MNEWTNERMNGLIINKLIQRIGKVQKLDTKYLTKYCQKYYFFKASEP